MSTTRKTRSVQARRVIIASGVGNFVEWYDFVIYGFSIPIIADMFFPEGDATAGLLAALAVYGVAFIARPFGGMVFGSMGDRIGRRNTLAVVILLMAIATVAIGVLPTYAKVGLFAPLLLVVARLAQGFSAGGEFTGAATFVAEHVTPGRRGLWVAGVSVFSLVGAAFAALTMLIFTSAFPASYAAWGWRVPFLVGGLVALVGLYLRLRLDETPAFRALETMKDVKRAPLREALRQHPRQLVLMFFVFGYMGLAAHSILGYMPTYLTERVGVDTNTALVAGAIILLVGAGIGVIVGRISDSVGRKPVIITTVLAAVAFTIPAFLSVGIGSDLAGAVIAELLLVAPYGALAGVMLPATMELLPARVRFAASAVGYNAAYMVFGGTAPFMDSLLVQWTGTGLGPAIYITVIAAVAFAAILVGLPETRHTSAAKPPLQQAPGSGPEVTFDKS